jgi:phosphopantothenoylcysteine decarboxylase/phosphopantothenate--cysteine ligase
MLKGQKIVITAGPTYEAIDPVRFIGNRSSGAMGLAIVNSCLSRGAEVFLIIGPVNLTIPKHPNLTVHKVESAADMYQAVLPYLEKYDIGIFAAAVADYTPKNVANQKIKKNEDSFTLELVKTVDILASIGKQKRENQLLVGFALETQHEAENAQEKLKRKNLDVIVLNSLNDAGAGFKHSTNKISIFDKYNNTLYFELKDKKDVAEDILNHIETLINTK